jgi:hypothetical protein
MLLSMLQRGDNHSKPTTVLPPPKGEETWGELPTNRTKYGSLTYAPITTVLPGRLGAFTKNVDSSLNRGMKRERQWRDGR